MKRSTSILIRCEQHSHHLSFSDYRVHTSSYVFISSTIHSPHRGESIAAAPGRRERTSRDVATWVAQLRRVPWSSEIELSTPQK